jgi:aspartyl protease family protein
MTTFQVSLEIGDLAGQRFEALQAIVDTGSTFTAVPREVLQRLGIRPARRHRFRIASGEVIENDVGDARVRLEGLEGTTPVVFNEPGEPVLLGAVTLESLLLGVDSVAQRLIPVEGLRVSRLEP